MFITLLKTRMSAMLSQMFTSNRRKNKKTASTGSKIALVFLMIFVLACFAFMFFAVFIMLCDAYIMMDLTWLYFSMAGIMALLLAFMGSIFMTQSQLYDAKDNEMLLAMPIKPSAILASRMVSLYVINLVMEALVMLPAGIVYLMAASSMGINIDTASVIIFVVFLFALPLLALTLSCIFGFIVALISSRMRNKSLITIILSIGLFIAYFLVMGRMNEYISVLMANGEKIAETLQSKLPPVFYFGSAISEGDFTYFLIFMGMVIVSFILVYALLAVSFVKIATTKRGMVKVKYKEKALKVSGQKSALLRKELARFFKSPMYIMNGCMGLIFLAIGCTMLIINKADLMDVFSLLFMDTQGSAGLVCVLVICAVNTMNVISAPSVSLDAKILWIAQSMPAHAGDVLDAKAMMHIVITEPITLIASVIVIIVASPMSIAQILLVILLPTALNCFFAYSGVYINMHMPKFDWISETVAIKQSGSIMVSMLLNMAILIVSVVLYALAANKIMSIEVYMYIILVLLVGVTYLMRRYLYNKGAVKYMSF